MKKFKKILAAALSALVIISSLPATVVNAAIAHYVLTLDVPYEMQVSSDGETVVFIPDHDGWYKFYTEGNWDTYAAIYDSEMNLIEAVDDTETGLNFELNLKLYSGYKYYLSIGTYVNSDQTATFTLYTEETVGVESIVITKDPNVPTVVKGYEEETLFFDGLEATFTLTNGSIVNWSYEKNRPVAGTEVLVTKNQNSAGQYYAEISCGVASAKFIYTTVENTVASIKYNGNPLKYYENSNGYYSNELQQYIYYYDIPADATMTVYYKNGSSVTAPISERIKEAYATTSENQAEVPWVRGTNNYVTLHYLGAETKIPVTILETPIAHIEILSEPTLRNYEDYYYPIFNGMKVRITDKNGNSDTVTLNNENTQYFGDGTLSYAVTVGDKILNIYYEYDLSLGEVYIFNCQGKEVKYANCSFTTTRRVNSLSVENVSPNGDGMKVTVNYADNTTDTLDFDVVDYSDYGNGNCNGYAMTKNGIAYYNISSVYENGRVVGYNFSTLNKNIYIEAPDYTVGDVDKDGVINICDATALQLWLADIQEFDFLQEYAADVNNDGNITVDDVTMLQLYVAKSINKFN